MSTRVVGIGGGGGGGGEVMEKNNIRKRRQKFSKEGIPVGVPSGWKVALEKKILGARGAVEFWWS